MENPPGGKRKYDGAFCQEGATWCHRFLFLSVWRYCPSDRKAILKKSLGRRGDILVYGEGLVKENVGDRLGDYRSDGIYLNYIVGEEVEQECLRANSTRMEVGYYIGRFVTPHFSEQLRPGCTEGSCRTHFLSSERAFTHGFQLCIDQGYSIGNQSSRFMWALELITFL